MGFRVGGSARRTEIAEFHCSLPFAIRFDGDGKLRQVFQVLETDGAGRVEEGATRGFLILEREQELAQAVAQVSFVPERLFVPRIELAHGPGKGLLLLGILVALDDAALRETREHGRVLAQVGQHIPEKARIAVER